MEKQPVFIRERGETQRFRPATPEATMTPEYQRRKNLMNRGPIDRPKSAWFASLVALCVGLGAQELLGSIAPVNFADWFSAANDATTIQFVPSDSLWLTGTMIRFLAFAMAGVVAVLLVGALTGRLLCMLLLVALLATIFEQFPSASHLALAAFWFLAAPGAVVAGAWIASAKRAGGSTSGSGQ